MEYNKKILVSLEDPHSKSEEHHMHSRRSRETQFSIQGLKDLHIKEQNKGSFLRTSYRLSKIYRNVYVPNRETLLDTSFLHYWYQWTWFLWHQFVMTQKSRVMMSLVAASLDKKAYHPNWYEMKDSIQKPKARHLEWSLTIRIYSKSKNIYLMIPNQILKSGVTT